MLSTFLKAFSERQLPKGIFPSGNFPNVIFPKWQLPMSLSQPQIQASSLFQLHIWALQLILAAVLGPHCSLRRLRRPNLTFRKLSLGKLQIWEVSTWEIVTCEVAIGKYLTPIKLIHHIFFQKFKTEIIVFFSSFFDNIEIFLTFRHFF